MTDQRLSVPAPFHTPRDLTDDEITALRAIADVLIPAGVHGEPAATAEVGFDAALRCAAHARADAFTGLCTVLADVDGENGPALQAALRDLERSQPEIFQPLSAIVAGAWLLLPPVRARIGYPGQNRNVAPLEQIVDELSTGILDPVLERGFIYTEPGD